VSDIETGRLILRLLPEAALAASAVRNHARLEALLGLAVPEVWFEDAWVAQLRLDQLRADPAFGPWSIRAIALKETGEIMGSINCHHQPMPFAANGVTRMAIEIGYSIFTPWQRQGFGHEALCAFAAWANGQGIEGLVLSISPENRASLALAQKLGATKIGSQIDEKDGPEDIFLAATEIGFVLR
jgi:RimJ/RimL family protein N-acetyltransferase